ncbi:hypothetical protein VTN49DRAFT_204 [Thermomyces lanuginosus]|uniref:uncharacterized protein n=1 Tax=Thermomyces lanuginosus TaxID=5541 RepID=UPI003743FD74
MNGGPHGDSGRDERVGGGQSGHSHGGPPGNDPHSSGEGSGKRGGVELKTLLWVEGLERVRARMKKGDDRRRRMEGR